MRISFEIGEKDLRYFRDRLDQVRKSKSARAEQRVIQGAAKLVTDVAEAQPPEFVQERMEKLSRLVAMVRDPDWGLEGADRERILDALAYFVDPDDIIPDRVPGLGYLDDAIMVELVVRELTHDIEAYDDFCAFREGQRTAAGDDAELDVRRKALQARMRRRRHRERSASRSSGGRKRSPFGLW